MQNTAAFPAPSQASKPQLSQFTSGSSLQTFSAYMTNQENAAELYLKASVALTLNQEKSYMDRILTLRLLTLGGSNVTLHALL